MIKLVVFLLASCNTCRWVGGVSEKLPVNKKVFSVWMFQFLKKNSFLNFFINHQTWHSSLPLVTVVYVFPTPPYPYKPAAHCTCNTYIKLALCNIWVMTWISSFFSLGIFSHWLKACITNAVWLYEKRLNCVIMTRKTVTSVALE